MELQSEIWKDIPEFEGMYQISNLGRVKSLARNMPQPHFPNRWFKEKILIAACGGYKKNYMIVNLKKNNKQHLMLVHRLIAEAFISNPENYETVNHINGNHKDNRIENLEWCSGLQNTRHYWDTCKKKRGVSLFKDGVLPNLKYRMRLSIPTGMKNFTLTEYFPTEEQAYKCYFDTYVKWYGIAPW